MAARIALADPLWGGHHASYLKRFARVLLERGHEVLALCPAPREIRAWADEELPALAPRLQCAAYAAPARPARPLPFSSFARAAAHWRGLEDALRAAGGPPPALTLLLWLDTLLHPLLGPALLDRLLPRDWAALYFHPRHLRIAPAGLRARLAAHRQVGALRARHCRAVLLLDEDLVPALSASLGGKPVYGLPDLADTTAPDPDDPLARSVRERAAGRTVVALAGGLAPRKGLLTLVEAARRLPPERYFFVFAGVHTPAGFSDAERAAFAAFAAAPPENCLLHLAWIPGEARFNALLAAADLLFAAYLDFPHSSNLLAKAAFLRRPVIVSRGHRMGELVARHRLGAQVDEGDAGQCAAAIEALAKDPGNPDYEGFLREHSPARFAAVLDRALSDAGLPPAS